MKAVYEKIYAAVETALEQGKSALAAAYDAGQAMGMDMECDNAKSTVETAYRHALLGHGN